MKNRLVNNFLRVILTTVAMLHGWGVSSGQVG